MDESDPRKLVLRREDYMADVPGCMPAWAEPEPDELSIEEAFKRLGAIMRRHPPDSILVLDLPAGDEQEDDDE